MGTESCRLRTRAAHPLSPRHGGAMMNTRGWEYLMYCQRRATSCRSRRSMPTRMSKFLPPRKDLRTIN
eukprot:2645922-Heterocapsa_arctica.AAC.1